MIIHGKSGEICLEADVFEMKLIVDNCNSSNIYQKWEFGAVNLTMINNWDTYGATLL